MKKSAHGTPRLFRKSYTEKKFEKKILRRIYIPTDREFLRSLFVKDEAGKWAISQNVPRESQKKLKVLAKAIKKNKGLVTTWKAALVLIPMALILLFNFIFKNRLIETGAERALESLFEAQSDIRGMQFSLLKGSLSFESLTIADKDDPLANLIDTGAGLVEIDMTSLAFKRFHIDEISLREVRWNTARDSDGSLPDKTVETDGAAASGSEDRGSSALSGLVGDFDYMSLLESRKDDLKSLQMLNAANEEIGGLTEKWSDRLDEKESEINSLRNDVSSLQSIDTEKLTDPSEIQSLITQIGTMKSKVETLGGDIRQLNGDFNRDKDAVLSAGSNLTSALDADMDFLGDSLDFSSGGFQSLASDMAEEFIRSRWNGYYEAGLRGWNIYKKLKSDDKEQEVEEKKGLSRSLGYNVPFPSPRAPRFYLDRLFVNGSDDDSFLYDFKLGSLSNEPDKVDRPVSLELLLSDGGVSVKGNGFLDLREKGSELFSLDVSGSGIPVDLPGGIPALSVNSLKSRAQIAGEIKSSDRSGMVESLMQIALEDIKIGQDEKGGFLKDAVGTIFESNNSLELTGFLEMSDQGLESVRVETDFDEILSNSVGAYLSDLENKALAELESRLMDYLSPALSENEVLARGLDQLGIQSVSQVSSVDGMESILNGKRKELENRAGSLAESLKSEAEGILEKATEGIKLPGF